MVPLRLVFMGTPDFAVLALVALIDAGHEVACVYTQPPRRAGRGQKMQSSPVHGFAEGKGIEVRHPATLRDDEAQRDFAALNADAGIVAAYGLILPAPILEAPRLGCLNIHASLLPRWRGAAPIQRAIAAGDAETGVTIMQLDEGLDTGDMLLCESVPIGPETSGATLHDTLAALGAKLIVEALAGLEARTLHPRAQPAEGVTYARKLTRDEARLDWRRSAGELERLVRAFDPWPGAWFDHAGESIGVLAAEVIDLIESVPPGTILDDRLTVACGVGALRPARLRRRGRTEMETDALLRGYPIPRGSVLDLPEEGEG